MAKKKETEKQDTKRAALVPVEVVQAFRDRNTGTLHLEGEAGVRYSQARIDEINGTSAGLILRVKKGGDDA